MLITKGARKGVFGVCTCYEAADGTAQLLDVAGQQRSRQTFEQMSRSGLRALAVAHKKVDPRPAYSSADESTLILSGYVGCADPPLPRVDETLAPLKRDGVEVKILTCDNEHVCSQLELANGRIVSGEGIDRLSDAALDHVAQGSTIFARVSPAQKTRILFALRRRGHVVGFLGDGINDAPSLRAAAAGIAIASAVDVAREAADIVLLERGLRILHRGVLEGRKALGNVMKFLTSSNFVGTDFPTSKTLMIDLGLGSAGRAAIRPAWM